MPRRRMLAIWLISLILVSTAQDVQEEGSPEQEQEEFMNEIRSKCIIKIGTDETINVLQNMGSLQVCLMSKIDLNDLSFDLRDLKESTKSMFFTKYCPIFNNSISCFDTVASDLRKCLNFEEIAILDGFISMLPEALNVACKDDGMIFFKEDTGLECTNRHMKFIERCSHNISNLAEAMDPTNYGPKQCDELVQFRKCFKQQLIECKAPSVMDFFDVFYRPVLRVGSCKDHIKRGELPQFESNNTI